MFLTNRRTIPLIIELPLALNFLNTVEYIDNKKIVHKKDSMKFFSSTRFSKSAGFTLLELLVVIGIIGILAVGLLAALDPLEQLRRGRDSNRKRIATEYQQAMIRYNASTGNNAWQATTPATAQPNATQMSNLTAVTQLLVNAGELKSTFTGAASAFAATMFVTATATGDVTVCFDPESRGDSSNWQQLYTNNTGGTAGTSTTCTATSVCYFCVR